MDGEQALHHVEQGVRHKQPATICDRRRALCQDELALAGQRDRQGGVGEGRTGSL